MPRTFNTAGPCLDTSHYMLPAAQRCGAIRPLIDEGLYFVLHAPRQTGKTTLIRNYARELTAEGKYAAVALSAERMTGEDPLEYLPMLAEAVITRSALQLDESLRAPTWTMERLRENPSDVLCALLGAWALVCPRPVVLFFDEVDALLPPVLVSVLRQLREGYCSRPDPFPLSIALVGMRDVRDYRASIRDETKTRGSSSPFNIKSESLTLRNFDLGEVRTLLGQHTEATGQVFEDDAVIEIFEQAQGQAADGGLDVRKMLDGFVEFWRRHGEVLLRGMPYQEAAPHLVLMAYLQRVINGGGRITREFALGTGRADLVVELGGVRTSSSSS